MLLEICTCFAFLTFFPLFSHVDLNEFSSGSFFKAFLVDRFSPDTHQTSCATSGLATKHSIEKHFDPQAEITQRCYSFFL